MGQRIFRQQEFQLAHRLQLLLGICKHHQHPLFLPRSIPVTNQADAEPFIIMRLDIKTRIHIPPLAGLKAGKVKKILNHSKILLKRHPFKIPVSKVFFLLPVPVHMFALRRINIALFCFKIIFYDKGMCLFQYPAAP